MSESSTTPASPRLYLLDVEGTVAPLSLTSEVLFPYARAHFESFLRSTFEEWQKHPELLEDQRKEGTLLWDMLMLQFENQHEQDPEAPNMMPERTTRTETISLHWDVFIPRALVYVYWLMDRDRKSTALKSLQGRIWKSGFESGELKGTLFDDVPPAFERWSQHGRIAIYSSGSTEAQQLLFRHSTHGDLTPMISGYFDTRVGAKAELASYAAIAQAMQVSPAEVLFFSDTVRELDAARDAGCQTRLVIREGNAPVPDAHDHIALESFATL